jgi:drug/metabolite transporter (DMT)-like permease
MPPSFWFLLFVGIFSSAAGGIFLQMGAVDLQAASLWQLIYGSLANWKIFLGLSFYIFPTFIWIFMLRKVDLSYLQPMFSLIYVVTPVLAMAILHEDIPLNRWIGICFIISGVLLVAKG